MYAITGATGNIGRVIAEQLLAKGEKVRAIGRSAERLQPLVDKGAEAIVAEMSDTAALTEAFKGMRAVYAMIPPNMEATNMAEFQTEVGSSIARAIADSGVKYVVNLSSVGADKPEGTGPIVGLHEMENRLNAIPEINVLHLRPASFMENHLWQMDGIREHGMMATPQEPDVPVPQIATRDIGMYAAERMTKLDFQGYGTRDLLGPADVTLNDMAAAIGREIGKEGLKYQKVTYEDSRNHMLGMGISEDAANNMIDLYKAANEGRLGPTEDRSTENTTPTSVTDFSKFFASIYKQ